MKLLWTTKHLGEACRFIDYRGRTPERTESGLRLITAKNVKMGFLSRHPLEFVSPDIYESWMTRGIPARGDVLFTTEAPLGNVAQFDTDDRVVFAQRIIIFQPLDGSLDRTFLKYLLLSDGVQERIGANGTGATVQGIKASLLKKIEICFPPLAEQQRIVRILDEAFAAIAKAKANAEKNLQNARGLFERYLQLTFAPPCTGWKKARLGTVAEFRNGLNFTVQSKGEVIKIVGVKDFQNNFWLSTSNLERVTLNGTLAEPDVLRKGDIIVVRSNGNPELIGRCIVASEIQERIAHSGFTIRIRLQSDELLPEYLAHFMKCSDSRRSLTAGGTGINIKSLNQQTLSALVVPFPRPEEQREIVNAIERTSSETQRLALLYRQKITALDVLRQSLLHQAFSGNL